VAPAHHVERIRVAFATRAKRVDVKKLKADLWSNIETKPKSLHLSDSIADLKSVESRSVTVPFYFICLLHLANEHGLELRGASRDALDDVDILVR